MTTHVIDLESDPFKCGSVSIVEVYTPEMRVRDEIIAKINPNNFQFGDFAPAPFDNEHSTVRFRLSMMGVALSKMALRLLERYAD